MTAQQAIEMLESTSSSAYMTNSLFVFLAAALVFIMQAGFALLETGYTRSKNTANIWLKNLMDFCVGTVAYLFIGFGLQYGDDFLGLFGTTGFFNPFACSMDVWASCVDMNLNPYVYFFFQLAFCGATATIISGAVAERFKFQSYLIVSLFMTGFIYPVASHWIWGGGWLAQLGIIDFAGTLAVHGIGGMAALVCAAFVGPRVGKYNADGSANAIQGHSISLAALGAIILWFGWYGFNPGSELGFDSTALYAAITTTIAGASGALGGLFFTWIKDKAPSVEGAYNGALAGMVSVCSTANTLEILPCILLGVIAGIIVVASSSFVEKKLHIDDACGAGSMHFVSGIPGVLFAGIFGSSGVLQGAGFAQLGVQLLGEAAVFAFVVCCTSIVCVVLRATMGIRVSATEEIAGMDQAEHNTVAYDYVETEQEILRNESVILKNESRILQTQ
ncbi:MAG: ammonium transporter [Butyricicoccus sp.]